MWLCSTCNQFQQGQSILQIISKLSESISEHTEIIKQNQLELKQISLKLNVNKPSIATNQPCTSATYREIVKASKQANQEDAQEGKKKVSVNTLPQNKATAKPNTNISMNKEQTARESSSEDFILVESKRKRKSTIKRRPTLIGKRANDDNGSFAAVERRAWLHVSRYPINTKADDLKDILKHRLSITDLTCELINSKHPAPTFASFKIGAPISYLDKLMDENMWENGIAIQRYNFFLERKKQVIT